jgi:serine protease inhibitor
MARLFLVPLLALLVFIAFISCNKTPDSKAPDSDVNRLPSWGSLKIPSKIIQSTLDSGAGRNILISPLNIQILLSQIDLGTTGRTEEALRRTILGDSSTVSKEEFHGWNKDYLKGFSSRSNTYAIQNLISYPAKFELSVEFKKQVQSIYKAQLFLLPDEAAKLRTATEKWPGLESLNTDGIEFISSLLFKANWKYPFDGSRTEVGDFHKGRNDTLKIPFMRLDKMTENQAVLGFYDGPAFKAVALPYIGEEVHFYAFLPGPNCSFKEILDSLAGEGWKEPIQRFRHEKIGLFLPKMKLESTVDLKESLSKIGVVEPFNSPFGDFSPMVLHTSPLSIVLMRHHIQVDVTETGTELVAHTIVVANDTSPIELRFDAPFLVLIRSEARNANLLLGVIADPSLGRN